MNTKPNCFVPLKRHNVLSLAIPASLVSDTPHLREKTLKIGLVGRAAAIFRVDEVIIFPDFPNLNQRKDTNLIFNLLSYLETPQYLRKRLFKLRSELRYVGILPPLRTPHHPLLGQKKDLVVGEHREGVVVSSISGGQLVDIGVEQLILLPHIRYPKNARIKVKITKLGKHPKVKLVTRNEIETYWGYSVIRSKGSFGQLIKKRNFDLVLATSRRGVPILKVEAQLKRRCKKALKTLVAFGAPKQGLYEISAQEHLELDEIADFIINTVPYQGVETIRTEEAIFLSLAVINLILNNGI